MSSTLNPKNNRIDYGEQLAPPAGYGLSFAVGTTYSLNLDALMGASLALGLSEETDSSLAETPIFLLEALRVTGEKVALFCEGGQIHCPRKKNDLYVLLEKMVIEVNVPKANDGKGYPSFHPKVWLIKYVNKSGNAIYRLLVMSRNLTFDRDWDVVCCIEGEIKGSSGSNCKEKNEPLCDFLRYLKTQLPKSENGKTKEQEIEKLINEIPNVVFETKDERFTDFEFIPCGISDKKGEKRTICNTDLFKNSYDEMLVISPFLSKDIVKELNERKRGLKKPDFTLFTRKMSLGRIAPDKDGKVAGNFDIYVMKDAVIDGESAVSDDDYDKKQQDIHAKIYMAGKNSDTSLYLGSLNASYNAVHKNVEFMIKLKAKKRHLSAQKLKEDLFCGSEDCDDNPFERITDLSVFDSKEEKEEGEILEDVIKDFVRNGAKGSVSINDDNYIITVVLSEGLDLDKFNKYTVELRPLFTEQKIKKLEGNISFCIGDVRRISEFFVLTVSTEKEKVERIVTIPLEGIPEEREKEVVNNIVKGKENFYKYVSFVLSEEHVVSMMELNEHMSNEKTGHTPSGSLQPALYEKLLKAAATNPNKLDGIDYMIKMLSEAQGSDIEDFKKLYKMVKGAIQ